MIQLPPVLGNFFNAVRSFERAVDPKLNVKTDPRLQKFQQPVQNVERLRKHRADSFDGSDSDPRAMEGKGKRQNPARFANLDLSGGGSLKQAATSQTAEPRRGATDVTGFLRNDGFEAASRKMVELTPKPPPTYKAPIPVFRFR